MSITKIPVQPGSKHRLDKKVEPLYEQGKGARAIARTLERSEVEVQESIQRIKKSRARAAAKHK